MNRRIQTAFALIVAGGGVLSASVHAQQLGEPVKIGVILALTGAGAGLGIPERNGAVLAEKIINSSGGIDGRPIQLIIEDDGSNPDGAISKANNLIHREKVSALIGSSHGKHGCDRRSIGSVENAPGRDVGTWTGDRARPKMRAAYRSVASPERAGDAGICEFDWSQETRSAVHSGYGTVVYNELRKLSDAYGIAFVATEKFEISATDTTSQAAKICAAQPDAIVVVGVTGFRSQPAAAANEATIIAANGLASYEPSRAWGMRQTMSFSPEFLVGEDPLPHQAEFVRLFHKEYGRFPKILEALGWGAVHVILTAFKKAGVGAANEKLCEAIRSPFKGDMTDYDFSSDDLNGIKLSNVVFSKLVGGQFTRLSFQAKEQ